MRLMGAAAAASLLALAMSSAALADEAADAGKKVFNKCMACHKVGPDAKNGVGPVLNGVVGRAAGKAEGFKYSALNHESGEAGLVWTEENIFAYLADPNAFLEDFVKKAGKEPEGKTKMTFKLANEDERKNVIAYLKTFP